MLPGWIKGELWVRFEAYPELYETIVSMSIDYIQTKERTDEGQRDAQGRPSHHPRTTRTEA